MSTPQSHTNTIDLNISAGPAIARSAPLNLDHPGLANIQQAPASNVGISNDRSDRNLHATSGSGLVKLLIPAYAAGSIIGKQGVAITQLQKQFGTNIKLSKPKDYYPGTLERIALIQGKTDGPALNEVVGIMVDKVIDFPIPKEMVMTNSERPRQVKIIVPNSTAGLIIGKKGATIKHIMETSRAKVQMTQKPEGQHMQPLTERVITVCGERSQLHDAVNMILEKIKDDPQSASCPNLTYQNASGFIANASPVGSPYAPVNTNRLLSAHVNGLSLVTTAQAAQTTAANGALTTASIPAHTLNLISNGAALPHAIQNLNLNGLGNQNGIYHLV